jgi:hypothetical protein
MTESFIDYFQSHNGKIVKLDGIAYKIKYSEHKAVYPYNHLSRNAILIPVNKRSKEYLETKRKLGDDWLMDAKDLSEKRLVQIVKQLGPPK